MSMKETLQYGSQGDSVKALQKQLNAMGYSLDVDGIFGSKTQSAVKQFQQKYGLDVDGIVGNNTWSALYSNNSSATTDKPTTTPKPSLNPLPTNPTYDTTSWDDTEKGSAALGDYNDAKEEVEGYGDFTYGNQQQFDEIMDKILNRDKFSYDLNGDALYQQYKDKYIKQGKMAMGDAIGQASAMTGGYGNSYAQSVGQQAYQAQLDNLNDIVPELYQMALDKYNMEGQDLYNQYGMLSDDRNHEYGVWNDKYGRLVDKLGIARSDYYDGGNMFYTEQDNKNAVAGQEFDDAMSIWNAESDTAWKNAEWDESIRQREEDIAYRDKRDEIEDAQWQATFDEGQRQFNAQHLGLTGGSPGGNENSTGNNSTGNNSTGGSYNNGSLSSDQIKQLQKALGVEADGYYGAKSQKAAGGLSAEEAYKKLFGGGDKPVSGFTGTTYEAAVEYAESHGVPSAHASGIMTASEWNRRKSSYQTTGTGGAEVKNYSSYKEYLEAITEYLVEKYN